MEHALINTIIAGIVTAFILGMIANRLKLPAIFGYLIAGIAIGPHTPGFIADVKLAQQLAEIGIILLMFGVGLHFSLKDLIEVRKIALPGALTQMACATVIGAIAATFLGYSVAQGMLFGFSLSVASTVVLLRSLEQRKKIDCEGGKIAIGWLIVEDIAMVLALVMLPLITEMMQGKEPMNAMTIATSAIWVLVKIGVFFAFMLVVGRRFLPPLLVAIARQRSNELTTLGTLAVAMGFASLAYYAFDASLAFGAFLAGMMLSGSDIGRRSAENCLPMRDAFSVLFFVSVGMLFSPRILFEAPMAVFITFLVIVVAKGASAMLIMRLFRQPVENGYTVAIGLAQIGEFSFILGSLALSHDLIPQDLYNLILAGAILSIVVNPFLFHLYDWVKPRRLEKVRALT